MATRTKNAAPTVAPAPVRSTANAPANTPEPSEPIYGTGEPTEQVMKAKAEEIAASYGKTVKAMLDTGRLIGQFAGLTEKRTFGRFVENFLPFGRTQAYRLLWLYRYFAGRPNLERYDLSALYLLCGKTPPYDAARAEAATVAAAGQKVTHDKAREIVKKHLPHTDRTPRTGGIVIVDTPEFVRLCRKHKVKANAVRALLEELHVSIRTTEGNQSDAA
jgi:hypothetical protein